MMRSLFFPARGLSRRIIFARLAVCIASGGLLAPSLAAPVAAGIVITDVVPTAAAPGDVVVVLGSGFPTDPSQLSLQARAGDQGVSFEIVSASPQQLVAIVGPAAAPFVGQLRLHVGESFDSSTPQVYAFDSAIYLVSRAWSFVSGDVVIAPQFFEVTDSAAGTESSLRIGPRIELLLEPIAETAQLLELDITIDTGGGSGDDDDDDGGGGGGDGDDDPPTHPGWPALSLRRFLTIEVFSHSTSGVAAMDLAADLAEIVNATFSANGLEAQAAGAALVLTQVPPLVEGFAVLYRCGG